MFVKLSFSFLCFLCASDGVVTSSVLMQKLLKNEHQISQFQFDYYRNMLEKFKGFSVIMHRDNNSLASFGRFNKQNRNYFTSIILNHDLIISDTLRPVGQRCVNVVALQDHSKFAKYIQYGKNIMGDDVVTFSINSTDKPRLSKSNWFIPNLERAGNVLVLQPYVDQCKVYLVCFYCGKSSGKLRFWGADRDRNVSVPLRALYPRTFDNFGGHLMKVGYINYYPYFYCFQTRLIGNENVCTSPQGSEFKLLQILSRKLNFKYRMIHIENETYSYLFDQLANGEIDFAIGGLSMTIDRVSSFHTSVVMRFEDVVFIMNYALPLQDQIFAFLGPFSVPMWSIIIIAALAMSYFYKKVYSLLMEIKLKNYPWTMFLRGFIEQPVHLNFAKGNRITILVIFFNWWIFVIFVSVAYKSKLASLLIHPKIEEMDGLEEIVSKGYSLVMDKTGNSTFSELFRTNDTEFYRFRDDVIFKRDLCTTLDYMKAHKSVIIGELSRTVLHSDIFCSPLDHNLDLRIPRRPLTQIAHTWFFKPEVPYSKALSKNIQPIVHGGFLNYWQKAIKRHQQQHHASIERMLHEQRKRVNVNAYISHFCLYFMGIAISSVCFIIEILFNRLDAHRNFI